MFYLLNQKFAEEARKATFQTLVNLAVEKIEDLNLTSAVHKFEEIIEIVNEMRVQSTSHVVNQATSNSTSMTVTPSEEVKF